MNKQEAAVRVMRLLVGQTHITRRELDLTIAAVLDIVDKRALRGWRFYLEAKGLAVPVKEGATLYRLQFPVTLDLDAYPMEEEEGETHGTDRQT